MEGALAASKARLSFRPARAALDELARLAENWDSYGASPPTAVAISTAHGLLATVAERYARQSERLGTEIESLRASLREQEAATESARADEAGA